jgi:undecaprenyl-diphosphatase
LPISSSAHLALAPWFLGWKDQGLTFDIALHFGTLAAVLLYFFRDWIEIAFRGFGLAWGRDEELGRNPRLLWYLAAATVPVGIAGLLFERAVETTLRNPVSIAFMLISVGLLMGWADRTGRCDKGIGSIGLADALWIGAAQALAIVPGTSRSGITITAARFRGMSRESAARFSFLLSTPAIAAAALKSFLELLAHGGVEPGMRVPFVLGVALSAATGLIVIRLLLGFLRRHSLRFFVAYRLVFGILIVALVLVLRPATG